MARVPTEEELAKYNEDGTKKSSEKYDKDSNAGRLHKDRNRMVPKQDKTLGSDGKPKKTYAGFNERYSQQNNNKGKNPGDLTFETYSDEEILEWIKLCRDNLNAWEFAPPDLFCINPRPMPENHFATFPVALPQRILKCACPKETCIKCGTPKIPITRPTAQYQKVLDSIEKWHRGGMQKGLQNYKKAVAAKHFESKCYVCGKRYGKNFHFHHLTYREDEKIHSDFSSNDKYQEYILPIIEKRPFHFELLCHKHHYLVEILKRFKPERLERLFCVVRRSQTHE